MLPFSKCKSFTSFAASGTEALAAGDYNVQKCEVEEPIREAIEGTVVHKGRVISISTSWSWCNDELLNAILHIYIYIKQTVFSKGSSQTF